MKMLFMLLFINILSCNQTVKLANCNICNNEICFFDVNASTQFIIFDSCQCVDTTKCGNNCFQHNYSRNEIINCIDKGIFCNDNTIRKTYSLDAMISTAFTFFIMMLITAPFMLVIMFYIIFVHPRGVRGALYMPLNDLENPEIENLTCLGNVKTNRCFSLWLGAATLISTTIFVSLQMIIKSKTNDVYPDYICL